MRKGSAATNIKATVADTLERTAIAVSLAPLPAAYAVYGVPADRILATAQRRVSGPAA